jgi:hypothetical protein
MAGECYSRKGTDSGHMLYRCLQMFTDVYRCLQTPASPVMPATKLQESAKLANRRLRVGFCFYGPQDSICRRLQGANELQYTLFRLQRSKSTRNPPVKLMRPSGIGCICQEVHRLPEELYDRSEMPRFQESSATDQDAQWAQLGFRMAVQLARKHNRSVQTIREYNGFA